MRAFMSDRGARVGFEHAWRPQPGLTVYESTEEQMKEALFEVRRILAETETVNGCMPLHCFNGRLADLRPGDTFHPSQVTEPKAALADALRAFVEA